MGVMDGVLNDAENRFGISGGSASSLLSGLFSCINEQGGGLRGMLDRFRQAGMGDSVSSWLSGTPEPISAESLESALGSNTISTIASKSALSVPMASSVLAFMFPKIIQRLTPGGVVPRNLPSEFMSYVGSDFSGRLRRKGGRIFNRESRTNQPFGSVANSGPCVARSGGILDLE